MTIWYRVDCVPTKLPREWSNQFKNRQKSSRTSALDYIGKFERTGNLFDVLKENNGAPVTQQIPEKIEMTKEILDKYITTSV